MPAVKRASHSLALWTLSYGTSIQGDFSVIMAAKLKQATKRDNEKLVRSEGSPCFIIYSEDSSELCTSKREKPSSFSKTLEWDELFFSNQQKLQASDELCHLSQHLWNEVHPSLHISIFPSPCTSYSNHLSQCMLYHFTSLGLTLVTC